MTAVLPETTIEDTLRRVAYDFPDGGRQTILCENFGKHCHETRLILDHLPRGGRILDLGGGDSIDLILLDRLHYPADKWLLDNFISPEENRMGNDQRPLEVTLDAGVQAVSHDAWVEPKLPFPDDHFDVVCVFDFLEHLPGSPVRLLDDVRRVVRPGGKLLLSGPNATALMRRVELLTGEHPYMPFDLWTNPGYISHYREYTLAEYQRLVERAGFTVIDAQWVLEPTATRARNRYHNRRHPRLSPVTAALWGLYGIEKLRRPLRPAVSVVGQL